MIFRKLSVVLICITIATIIYFPSMTVLKAANNEESTEVSGYANVVNTVEDLKDSHNKTPYKSIWVNGFKNVGDGGGGIFYWDPAATEKDNGGTVVAPSENSAVGRWRRVVEKEINVKWFGATGNGLTDDTAKIQKAIESVSGLAKEISGQTVIFPKGRYRVTSPIVILYKGITLEGVGSESCIIDGKDLTPGEAVIKFVGNNPPSGQYNFFSIRNMAIRDMSNRGAGSKDKTGLDIDFCQKGIFENLFISGFNTGILLHNNSHMNKISSCDITGNHIGVQVTFPGDLGGANENSFYDCSFRYNDVSPLDAENSGRIHIIGGDFEGNNGTIKTGTNAYVVTRLERNKNNVPWLDIYGDSGYYKIRIMTDKTSIPSVAFRVFGNNNKLEVNGQAFNLLDEQSTGKNNQIILGTYRQLSNGLIMAGSQGSCNWETFNPVESNLLAFSNSPEQWARTGKASFAYVTLPNGGKYTKIIKKDKNPLIMKQMLNKDFEAGSYLFIQCNNQVMAGNNWQLWFNGQLLGELRSDSFCKSLFYYRFTGKTINPSIELRNMDGEANSTFIFGDVAVQSEPGPYMMTMNSANVKYDYTGVNPPTQGTFFKGQIITNAEPSGGKYAGWICVESGTPGVWKGFGLINK